MIASVKLNPEYALTISRLSEIENHGALPTIYRLYTLCVIYRISLHDVLSWYSVNLNEMAADQNQFTSEQAVTKTRLLGETPGIGQDVSFPLRLDPGLDLRETTYLTRMIEAWGKVPLSLLENLNLQDYRYGLMGLDDWMMHPLIPPGSFLQIDARRCQVEAGEWKSEYDRPIYFIEHREGYACAWAHLKEKTLLLQPHPLSPCAPRLFSYRQEAEVVGQVVGVAKQLSLQRTS